MSTQTTATAPYGTWTSPLTPQALTTSAVSLSQPRLDAHASWWVEGRPELGGRSVLVRCPDGGEPADVDLRSADGSPADVRTRVHEYGGAAYDIAEGVGVAVLGPDSALVAFDVPADGSAPSGDCLPLTPAGGARYGAPAIDSRRRRVVVVREDHERPDRHGRPVSELVSVPLDGSAREDPSAIHVLVGGRDFVASPAISADASLVALLAWDDPEMPWTGAEVIVVELDEAGRATGTHHVAGGHGVAAQDPSWGPDGDLVFLDDSSGWTNPYRLEGAVAAFARAQDGENVPNTDGPGLVPGEEGADPAVDAADPGREMLPEVKVGRLRAIHRSATDFGLPQWGLGPRGTAVLDDFLVAIASEEGRRKLVALRRDNGQAEEWTGEFEPVGGLDARDGRVLLIGASAHEPAAVLRLDVPAATVRVLRSSAPSLLEPEDVSVARALTWDSPQESGQIYGFWYAPRNSRFVAPGGELPPAIVRVHGGPTSAVSATYDPAVQFWTTRGFGVLDVNYGGSTGYGRAYQDRLEGQWGLVDVADCLAGARHLVTEGFADPSRLAISGGSAGGMTVVNALAVGDVFTAGLVRYGVMDLTMLARETHKFESRYLDGLIAPWPDGADVYAERSPLAHLDRVNAPVLVQQGTEDAVVPPNQSRALADALRAKGLPVALVEYEGEGHGFRRAENIQAAAAAELTFLGRVWGFEPAGGLAAVEVENL